MESFIDRHQGGERGVLVYIELLHHHYPDELAEFQELVQAAAIQNLELVTSKRQQPSPKYYVGSGLAESIKSSVLAHQADVVLFNHPLTPAQGRNLETLLCCRVIDRNELILDIFAQRARSFEGKLQVELAQLEHLRTRLIRGWTHLERQKGGIGLRGPGETQLETDRRLLDMRIKSIKKRLQKVFAQRQLSRRRRSRNTLPSVSLVGYTNAGKSTLFNSLTQAQVYVADQLFATLDPTLRQFELVDVGKVIFADTVGFIRQLPHDLVAAFHATLEEARQADLLIHVVDASHPHRREYIDSVQAVLEEIGAQGVPQLLVFNKIDLMDEKARIDPGDQGGPRRVWLSATGGEGLDLLAQALSQCLSGNMIERVVILAPNETKLRAQLYQEKVVQNEQIDEQGNFQLQIRISMADYQRILG